MQLENAGLRAENQLLRNQLTYFQDLFANIKHHQEKSTASSTSNAVQSGAPEANNLSNESGHRGHRSQEHSRPSLNRSDEEVSYPSHAVGIKQDILKAAPSKLLAETTSDDEIYSASKTKAFELREQCSKHNNSFDESNHSSKLSSNTVPSCRAAPEA